jgi:hypothetical protein
MSQECQCTVSFKLNEHSTDEVLRITKTTQKQYIVTGSQGVCTWNSGSEEQLASYVASRLSSQEPPRMVMTTNMLLPPIQLSTHACEATAQIRTTLEYMKHMVSLKPSGLLAATVNGRKDSAAARVQTDGHKRRVPLGETQSPSPPEIRLSEFDTVPPPCHDAIRTMADALLRASKPLYQACLLILKTTPGTHVAAVRDAIHAAIPDLHSVLDGVAVLCQKTFPSAWFDATTDVSFDTYIFTRSEVVWLSGYHRTILALAWNGQSFAQLA